MIYILVGLIGYTFGFFYRNPKIYLYNKRTEELQSGSTMSFESGGDEYVVFIH